MTFSTEAMSLMAPAFAAGLLIALIHVPLGIEVLRRGIIFLDLAIAQFAALGMICFHILFEGTDFSFAYHPAGPLLSGLVFALICAGGFQIAEKRVGAYQEALIGAAFIGAASLSILIIAGQPHGSEQIKDILAGQILWITWRDIFNYGPVFVITALLWSLLKTKRTQFFYLAFALVIPFSVKLAGIYLVFASLVLPALATIKMKRRRIIAGLGLSALSLLAGLMFSYMADVPAGPAIVLSLIFLSAAFFYLHSRRAKKLQDNTDIPPDM